MASAGEQNVDGVNQRTQGSGHPRRRQAVARSRVSMSDQPGLWSSARGQQVRGVSQQVGVRRVRDVREPSRFMASVLANKQQVRAMAGPASRRSEASSSSRKDQGVSKWSAEPWRWRANRQVCGICQQSAGRSVSKQAAGQRRQRAIGRSGEQEVSGISKQPQGPRRQQVVSRTTALAGEQAQHSAGCSVSKQAAGPRHQRVKGLTG